MTSKQLKQGQGWRLGWNPDGLEYQGLVGGEAWAIELTAAELADFCRLYQQLVTTMLQMQQELMSEETISCEASSDRILLEVCGYPQSYELKLIVLTGRRGEGQWPAAVTPELWQALQTLSVF